MNRTKSIEDVIHSIEEGCADGFNAHRQRGVNPDLSYYKFSRPVIISGLNLSGLNLTALQWAEGSELPDVCLDEANAMASSWRGCKITGTAINLAVTGACFAQADLTGLRGLDTWRGVGEADFTQTKITPEQALDLARALGAEIVEMSKGK